MAWKGTEALNVSVRYCRLPRGASVCDRSVTLPSPGGDTVLRPRVFVSGATVHVIAYRYLTPSLGNRDFLWTSTNRGDSFGAPVPVGNLPMGGGEAVAGPGAPRSRS